MLSLLKIGVGVVSILRSYKNRGKFVIYGTNAAGLASKLDSLKNVCKTIQPKVFMVQETKLSKHKELKIDNYEMF